MRLFGGRKNWLVFCGAVVIGVLAAVALAAPLLAPYDPTEIHLEDALSAPSARYLLGTDPLGRDLFSRMIYGTRVSLSIGIVSVGIAVLIGILVGATAGYCGGAADNLLMRFTDLMLCFPTLFLILAAIAFLPPSIYIIMLIIGCTGWMGVARLMRAEILSLKEREFVMAARVAGSGGGRILFVHLIPNGIAPVLVSATLGVAGAILLESSLSFLGLGVQPPMPSWGNILAEGRGALGVAWWLTLFPGLAILITVLGYNLLGEGLRDAFSPQRRSR